MKNDYTMPHVLLPFLAEFMSDASPYKSARVEMVRDGSLRFALKRQAKLIAVSWSEKPVGAPIEVAFSHGVVRPARSGIPASDSSEVRRACAHVARRLSRLLQGNPPHLLQFRNRNPQRIQWGVRMFNNLCPELLVRDRTRYFDYIVADLNEYEGFVNVEFRSRQASVILRLTLANVRDCRPLMSWGPISMIVLKDSRTRGQHSAPEHRVEEFLGYLLSRNLPPRFDLEFEFNDPPANYLPSDQGVDFIHTERLDDTSFFEMLLSTSKDIGVVTSCDRECFNLFSLVAAYEESWTTTTPWRICPSPDYLEHCYNLNLDSRSTIMGSDGLARCLETLGSSRRPPGLIVFFDSCLHRLIGEDSAATLQHFRGANPTPLVRYDIRCTQIPYLGSMRSFWKDVFSAVARKDLEARPSRVCFLGLTPDRDGEMERVLSALGVETGARIFPFLPLEQLAEIRRCSLVVANSWEYVRIIFSDLLQDLDRPVLRLALPYGVEGTNQWLRSISKALFAQEVGLQDVAEIRRASEEFDGEVHHIRGQRIGLFARYRGVANRLSPRLRFGVPLIEFLHELGLGIDLNLFVGPEDEPDPDGIFRSLGLQPSRGDSVGFYGHFRELPGRIEAGDFPMVYTETFRDDRITASGKLPLHLHQLQPGHQGAIRTARLIRTLLASDFFRLHRAYFRKPFAQMHHTGSGRPGHA